MAAPTSTSTKAIASGVAATLVAFLTGMGTALQTPGVTPEEWVAVALATVIGGAAGFGITWQAPPNRPIQ